MKIKRMYWHIPAFLLQVTVILVCMGIADHILRMRVESAERWVFWVVPAAGAGVAVVLISLIRYLFR